MARNPQEEADFQADESRRHAQVEYDPKLHGAGTSPVLEPSSVKELFKYVEAKFAGMDLRVSDLENKPAPATKKSNGAPKNDTAQAE